MNPGLLQGSVVEVNLVLVADVRIVMKTIRISDLQRVTDLNEREMTNQQRSFVDDVWRQSRHRVTQFSDH